MAKLVGVLHDESADSGGGRRYKASCLARRQVPLAIEDGLKMIMALDDACLACGAVEGNFSPTAHLGRKSKKLDPERESFLRKYEAMSKDELSAAFMVTFDDLLAVLSAQVPCVGCRRSVECLLDELRDESALEPLVITEDKVVSVSRDHILAPMALANLFCDQMQKMEASHLCGLQNFKSKKNSKVGRCAAHSLGLSSKKAMILGHWLDTWECMERECQEEVVLIHFNTLRQTLDRYLKKHSFCSECTNMVNKAYNLLVHEDEDLGQEVEEHSHECGGDSSSETLSLSPSPPPPQRSTPEEKCSKKSLYKGITACPADQHVHVECTPSFVSKLITMAEPELSGLRQERHAKTIEIAQKEVLTCIGICLYDRFQRIQQRLREGQQACDLLFLMALKSLKKSFEMAFENKQGISDLEKFCLELDAEERRKQEKAQKKRDKKSKQTKKKKELKLEQKAPSPPSETVSRKNRTRIPTNKELPSLESMLMNKQEDPTDNEENFIPLEDIQEFRARMPVVNRQREELRKTLRLKFNQLCVNGL